MSRASRIFAFVVVAWTTASPFLWRHTISDSVGTLIPWEFMVQPAALAAIGLLALPGFWLGVRWVAWTVIAAVAVVVLSQLTFPPATPSGLLMNGALLCLASVQALRLSGQHPRLLT
jgi:hypothetical protein